MDPALCLTNHFLLVIVHLKQTRYNMKGPQMDCKTQYLVYVIFLTAKGKTKIHLHVP